MIFLDVIFSVIQTGNILYMLHLQPLMTKDHWVSDVHLDFSLSNIPNKLLKYVETWAGRAVLFSKTRASEFVCVYNTWAMVTV